jgi:hypothetical protein
VSVVNNHTGERFRNGHQFLMIDESPTRLRSVRKGEIIAWPAQADGRSEISGGLIHHWLGAMFIANTTLDSVFDVFDDYDSYTRHFSPTVVSASLIDESGSSRRFSMRLAKRVMFVNAAIDAQYESVHYRNGGHRWYSLTQTTQVRQIENFGQPTQRVLSPDVGSGYIWRLCGISRFEERDGGVYIEVEAIALTRTVPTYATWLISPMITRLSKSALVTSLSQTREAVRMYSSPAQQLVRR